MTAVLGMGSRIAQEFAAIVGRDVFGVKLDAPVCRSASKLLVCTGYLAGKSLQDIGSHDEETVWRVNFSAVAKYVDAFLAEHETGRVCVIGSESGIVGSYDMAYAGAKAALHLYVETRALRPEQQLVAIAPGIVGDAKMTTRRTDMQNLAQRADAHPKRRFCLAREVASLATWLLGPNGEYVSGTVIRMNGGERR